MCSLVSHIFFCMFEFIPSLLRTKDDQETIKLINNDIQMIKKLEEKESNTSGYPLQHANMKDNDKTQNRILTKLNQNIMYEKPL